MEPLPDFSFPFLDDVIYEENACKFTIEFSYIHCSDDFDTQLLHNANGLYAIISIDLCSAICRDPEWVTWPEIVAEIRLNAASEHFYDSDSNMASVDVDTIEQYVCAVEKFNSAMLF